MSKMNKVKILSVYYRWNAPDFTETDIFLANILRKKYTGNSNKFEKLDQIWRKIDKKSQVHRRSLMPQKPVFTELQTF